MADAAEAPPSKRQRLEAAFEAQGEAGRQKRRALCCSMCLSPFVEPVSVKPLGNTYCKGCITAWLSENRTDPLSGTRLTVRQGNIAAVLVPNLAVQQIIDAQSVPCRYAARGCEACPALGDLEAHEANCPCKPSKCARCVFVGSRLEIAAHEQACPFVVLGPVLDAQDARIRNLEGEVRDAKRRLTAEHEASERLKARLEALEAARPGDQAVVSPARRMRTGPRTGTEPVFQYPPSVAASDSIVVTRGDLHRLEPGEYLNEKLVDFYLKVIVADARRSPLGEDPAFGDVARDVHAFSSHFFTKLRDGDPLYRFSLSHNSRGKLKADSWEAQCAYARVERWTRGVDVFAKKFLLVPVVEDLHWSLAIVCHPGELARRAIAGHTYPTVDSADHEDGPARPCVIHMDSRGSSLHSARKIEKYLRCFLEMEWRKRHSDEEPFTLWEGPGAGRARINPADLPLASPKVPQQTNPCDSGLYALRYAQEFLTRAVCGGAALAVNGRDVSLDFRDHDFEAWFTGSDIAEERRDIKKLAADLELEKIRAAYRRDQEVDALFNEGLRHKSAKKWREMIAALQRCVELDPNKSEAWFWLGMAYYYQNGMENCEAQYEPYTRCIALDPKHAMAHNNLGLVLRTVRKDYDGAARHYREAIELEPKNTRAHWNLSIILEEQRNDIPGAVKHMEEYVRLGGTPGCSDGKDRLATLRYKLEASP